MSRLFVGMLLLATVARSQTPGPAMPTGASLRGASGSDYDRGHPPPHFQRAVILEPQRADIRKDLGYTLLKIGQSPAHAISSAKPCH